MNKKGFTLNEILIVSVIIVIIMIIAIPLVMTISRSIKQRELDVKIESFLSAAELYAKNNEKAFGNATTIVIDVRRLLDDGYLLFDIPFDNTNCKEVIGCIINPVDKSSMNDELITIRRKKSITIATYGIFEKEKYYLNFERNGATSIGAKQLSLSLECEAYEGESCSVKAPIISRDGYEIIGWNKDNSSVEKEYSVNDDIFIDSKTNGNTYYAITKKDFILTFNKNTALKINDGDTNVEKSCSVFNEEQSCSIQINDIPTITSVEGKEFIGWNTNRMESEIISIDAIIKNIFESKTYYAIEKSTQTYTCSKDAETASSYTCNEGTLNGSQCERDADTDSDTTVVRGDTVRSTDVLSDGPIPTKDCIFWLEQKMEIFSEQKINCEGGGTYTICCGSVKSYSSGNGYYYCTGKPVKSCTTTTTYSCHTGWNLIGEKCYKAATSNITYSCSEGSKVQTKCYLYNQFTCPIGWTKE